MNRKIFSVLCVGCVLVAGALTVNAKSWRFQPADHITPAETKIINHVLDLLDRPEILGGSDTQQMAWESARFDTSQFNRIGLRFSVEAEQALVTCAVCWDYGRGDEDCLEGVPSVTLPRFRPFQVTPGDFGVYLPDAPSPEPGAEPLQRPDGLPDLYSPRQWYPVRVSSPNVDFTEVRGLGARVRCTMNPFLVIGDDPNQGEPGSLAQAVLTDVKVLLRRE